MIDVVSAQQVMTELLTDSEALRCWRSDPGGYAGHRLNGGREASMIADLDDLGVTWTADGLAAKTRAREHARHHQAERREDTRPRQPPRPHVRPDPLPSPSPSSAKIRRPLIGLCYRPALFMNLFSELGLVEVWEHTIDSFLGGDQYALGAMAVFADGPPLSMHSLDLSVGSPQARDQPERLEQRRRLLHAAQVDVISDHLAYSRVAGRSLPHFAPLWRVEETLDLVATNVDFLQHTLGVRLALENVTLGFDPGGDIGTSEFLNEITRRTGCGVHLDITNLTINAANGFCDAAEELAVLDGGSVLSVHLAGGVKDESGVLRDAHAFPVPAGDIAWFERLLPDLVNCRSVVVERDSRQAQVAEVVDDLLRVRAAVDRALAPTETARA